MPGALHDRKDLLAHGPDAETVRVLEAQLLVERHGEPVLSVDVLLPAFIVEGTHVRLLNGIPLQAPVT